MGSLGPALKPIFLVTHPRACSTAFERAILTREHDLICVHEPFSDAYHWGPEKLSERYENVEKLREEKGLQDFTFHAALKVIRDSNENNREKRVFVKDMAKCLMPLDGKTPQIAPSLQEQDDVRHENPGIDSIEYRHAHGGPRVAKIPNPTVIPRKLLSGFHFAFLIRDPRLSIPSLYECSRPPKSNVTGWHGFKAEDAGYKELRRLFDYLVDIGQIDGHDTDNEICVIDAESLLASPQQVMQRFCESVGINFDESMLRWGTDKDRRRAEDTFRNWAPFHDAVLKSTSLMPRPPKESRTPEADLADWTRKYGSEAAGLIQRNVDVNMPHYLYLKQFATSLVARRGGV